MNLRTIFKILAVSEIDNLAYRLYWNYNKYTSGVYECSDMFFEHKQDFKEYYEEAIIMLRKEKIKQLKENICLKKVKQYIV